MGSFQGFVKTFLILFLFVNWNFSSVLCGNITSDENVIVKAIYGNFLSIVRLSNNFRQFPMRDDFKRNISSLETQTFVFHQRLLKLLELYGISEQCRQDILQVNIGLEKGEDWAQRMVDSFTKPGPGLVELRIKRSGSYDECVKVYHRVETFVANSSRDHVINGGYYITHIHMSEDLIPPSSRYLIAEAFPKLIRFDSCFPDTCSATDVNLVVQAVANQIEERTSPVPSKTRNQKYNKLTTGGYITIGVICILAILLVLGTAYDILVMKLDLFNASTVKPLHYTNADAKSSPGVNGVQSENHHDDVSLEQEFKETEGMLKKFGHELKKDFAAMETETVSNHKGKMHEFFMAFSVLQHCKELLTVEISPSRIGVIEGIRVLTMGWIIMMHTFYYAVYISANYELFYRDNNSDWSFYSLTVPYSVDTFFTLSGCLMTYLSMKRMEQDGGARKFPWLKFYILRFWRLSPTFYLVFFVFWKVLPSLSSGPVWINFDNTKTQHGTCDKLWLPTLLYVNNFYKDVEHCFAPAWYLSADTQFYMISPVLLILFYHYPKIAVAVASVFMVISVVAIGILTRIYEWIPILSAIRVRGEKDSLYMPIAHYSPLSHVSPWMIGMALGYLLYTRRNTIKVSKLVRITGWCLALFSLMFIVFIPATAGSVDTRRMVYSHFNTLFICLSRTVWSLSISWIVFICAIGQGGFVNRLMSWKPYIVVGRLTFTTYLVHLLVVFYFAHSRRALYEITDVNLAYDSVGNIVLSFLFGFVVTVCVERPMFALKNVFIKAV